MSKEKPVYEQIRKIPVFELLKMEPQRLDKFEKEIKKEAWRAKLALQWIQGVKKLKKENGGGNNG